MSEAVQVRFARQEELTEILALYAFLYAEPQASIPLDKAQCIWESLTAHPDFFRYIVAEQEGHIVATANITLVPNLTWSGRPWAIVENVVTHPLFRGMGIGRAVMRFAISHAKAKGCHKIELMSNMKRLDAHRFYESLGFQGDASKGFMLRLVDSE